MPLYKTKEKNADGLVKYRVRVNYTDRARVHHSLTRIAYGLTAARDLERRLSAEIAENGAPNSRAPVYTVGQLFDEYIRACAYELRRSSIKKKRTAWEHHLRPYFATVPLVSLDVRRLSAWKQAINKKGLRLKTKTNIFAELRALLNYAVKMEYLPMNPISKIENFRDSYAVGHKMEFYTPEEFWRYASALLESAECSGDYSYYVFFSIAYFTGCRKGEIHALRWSSLNDGVLSIRSSISQKIGGGDVETPPKNKSSIRQIPLRAPLLRILDEHKKRQQAAIPDWAPSGFIVNYFAPLRDSTISNVNIRTAAAAGLRRIRVHDFRHSFASLLINSKVNRLEVRHLLGHSTVEQTLKTYAHLFPAEGDKALAVLNSLDL